MTTTSRPADRLVAGLGAAGFVVGLCLLAVAIGSGALTARQSVLVGASVPAAALVLTRPVAVLYATAFGLLLPLPRDASAVGGAVYLVGLALPFAAAAVVWLHYRDRPPPGAAVPVGLAFGVVVLGAAAGVLANPSAAFVRELVGPMHLAIGVWVGTAAARDSSLRAVLVRSLTIVLWASTVAALVTALTGVRLVAGGTVAEVFTIEEGTRSSLDVLRFQIAPTHTALVTLCAVLACVLLRPAGVAIPAMLVRLGLPSLALTFLSFSRNSLLAVALTVVATVPSWRRADPGRVSRRLALVAVVGSCGFVVALFLTDLVAGSAGWERNPLRQQADAYRTRVVQALSGERLAEDPSATWRVFENRHGLEAIRTRPVAGGGFGASYRPPVENDPIPRFGEIYAHNYYLWVAIKTGLVGLTLILVLFLTPVARWSLWAAARRSRVELTGPLVAALFGALGVLLVAPFAFELESASPFGVLVGLAWGWAVLSQPRDAGDVTSARRADELSAV